MVLLNIKSTVLLNRKSAVLLNHKSAVLLNLIQHPFRKQALK